MRKSEGAQMYFIDKGAACKWTANPRKLQNCKRQRKISTKHDFFAIVVPF
jgi:hypothetical protein